MGFPNKTCLAGGRQAKPLSAVSLNLAIVGMGPKSNSVPELTSASVLPGERTRVR